MSWQADGNRNAKGQFIKGNTAAMDRADAFDAKLPKILLMYLLSCMALGAQSHCLKI